MLHLYSIIPLFFGLRFHPSIPTEFFSFPIFQRGGEGFRGNEGINTAPCRIVPVPVPLEKPAPSATASSSGMPPEPLMVKPNTTTVHVTGSFAEWITLGLPADLCMLLPIKLPRNHSQHTCPLCGDIKMSANGAYNHICIEHLGLLLQCCFCSWSSGSACMMREHILKHHRKDDGSCMISGLEPTPRAILPLIFLEWLG